MKSQDRQPLHGRLVKTACCGRALALMTTVIVFFTFLPIAHSAAPPGEWWNANYGLCKKITITAGSTNVPSGYSVSFTEDTATLITNSRLRSDGNDWRVVYWNGSSWVELDRWVDDIIGDGWNSANTITWFKTQAGITASSSDDNYYVYYGYSGETQAAPAYMSDSMGADVASNVFWYADDFEEHAANTDPDGWTDQGTEDFKVVLHGSEKWFQPQTSNVWTDGSTASGMANVGDAIWSAKTYYHQAGTNAWGGIGVHIANGGVGRIVVVRDGAYYHADETFVGGPWIANTDIHFPLGTQGRIELVTNGTNLDAYWYNPSGYSPEKVTLFTGYTMLSGTGKLSVHSERPWTALGNDRWVDVDDIIIRQYVTSEPTFELGPQVSKPMQIDCDFSEWTDGIGTEFVVDDGGGADDWTNPAKYDITRFGVASNLSDTFYLLFGFDDILPGQTSAAVLIDTDLDDNINYALVVELNGAASTVELFTCDNSIPYGCGNQTISKTYTTPGDYCVGTGDGPWNTDTFVEVQLPYSDLGSFTGGSSILTSLISYKKADLSKPKDSIYTDYYDRTLYDTDTGEGETIPKTGTPTIGGSVFTNEGTTSVGIGKTVGLLRNGSVADTDITDEDGYYFMVVPSAAGDNLLSITAFISITKGCRLPVSSKWAWQACPC